MNDDKAAALTLTVTGTIAIILVWLFANRSPCPEGYTRNTIKTIDGITYYRCCKSWHEISGNKFKEIQDCQILKVKPSYWEEWFE